MERIALTFLFWGLVSCTPGGNSDSAGGADSSDSGPEPTVTWYADIEPILAQNCAACHEADGIGGVDLSTYETASQYADLMVAWVATGWMPLPAADPSCRDYHGSDRKWMDAASKEKLYTWANEGAPKGSPDSAPEPVDWTVSLENPDTEWRLPIEHTIVPDDEGNQYYCYVIENDREDAFYITGFDVELTNPAAVHHMVLAVDSGNDAGEAYGDFDTSDGFECADPIIESDWLLLHGWSPGQHPTELTDGYGMRIEPGDQIVLQMHYFTASDDVQVDQSAYVLETTDTIENEMFLWPVGPYSFTIPAGESAHKESYTLRNYYGLQARVHGVLPHMHWLGSGYYAAVQTDGEEDDCLVSGDSYSFDHQGTYMFKETTMWGPDQKIYVECTWDNSTDNPYQYYDPPQDIPFGEGTNEEMCFFLSYFSLESSSVQQSPDRAVFLDGMRRAGQTRGFGGAKP